MHLLRCHAALSLLLPLLLASVVVVLVEASTAAFLSRNPRSSLTEASTRQVRDADAILLKRSASLSFGLLVRGGHADNDESTQMKSDEDTKVDDATFIKANKSIIKVLERYKKLNEAKARFASKKPTTKKKRAMSTRSKSSDKKEGKIIANLLIAALLMSFA